MPKAVTVKQEPNDDDTHALLHAGVDTASDPGAPQTQVNESAGSDASVKAGLVDTLKSALAAAVTVQAREAQLQADATLYRGQAERLATRERAFQERENAFYERENGFQVQAARKDAELADARYQWAQERIRVLEANTEKEQVVCEMRRVQALLDQEKTKGAQGDAAGRAAQATIASVQAERNLVHERELKAETDRRERAERSALELSKKLVRLQVELRSENTALREQVETLTKELEGERAAGSTRRDQLAAEVSSLRVQLKAANENKATELREISAYMKTSQENILGLETQLRTERTAREAEARCIGAMTADAEAERVATLDILVQTQITGGLSGPLELRANKAHEQECALQ
ncbi:uncharacterized protein B0H18DRAFT_1108614 [Fomitopsis serialis]|uniref:uncharacterized protein n=1 Tax=Fomitopsis serialis TaxID=139415 RepID=UPI0020074BA1|nr:uncharacterized protein B0H18DRAFT_1108614 [Neoantrodia serialis]KAH9913626.1 hypothetical protein B0H18DRAFT_1108614 [Neoantrodia serialis]